MLFVVLTVTFAVVWLAHVCRSSFPTPTYSDESDCWRESWKIFVRDGSAAKVATTFLYLAVLIAGASMFAAADHSGMFMYYGFCALMFCIFGFVGAISVASDIISTKPER